MSKQVLKVSGICILSFFVVVASTFCCCIQELYAQPIKENAHQCCLGKTQQTPIADHRDCDCQDSLKVLAVKKFVMVTWDLQTATHLFIYPRVMMVFERKPVAVEERAHCFSSDPPIYILNSVYRC